MNLGGNEEPTQFSSQETEDEKELPNEELEIEIEAPVEEPEDTEVEIPVEQLEEQGVVDDPVRMYLHEIGRVHLLTAEDEKSLAKKLEGGKRVNEIKQSYLRKFGRYPSATEVMLTVLGDVGQAAPVIRLLQQRLGLEKVASFVQIISDTKLRDSIDSEINEEMSAAIAQKADRSAPETALAKT
jgi:RNA polymerase primary sigma factor